ncbi:restin homolog isoform X5 [Daphnia pulicaria]|uniref:restin homolog isoform X5 n=1 Tax=Daphnia pulicaria TaxID=35523 RepID=UPI001EE9FD8A|nr:restin homolog isoform X5 [Daphnia pulicaria]
MERKSFGFTQSRFMTKKPSPHRNSETTTASPIVTPPANPFSRKPPQNPATSGQSSETGELAHHEPQMEMGACFPGFFHSTRSSPTNRPSRFFSPASKKIEEYPFTPTIKSTNWRGDDTRSPITPADSPSPRVTSHPTSFESSGEVEGLFIHRPHISAGLPSFFQRPFSSPASEFSFTPKRKPTVAEISPDKSSSPIGFASSSVTPFSTPSRFKANSFLHTTNRSSEQQQLPIETQDQQFKDESGASAGANDSEHSAFYRFQLNETVDSEKPYLDDSNRERKSSSDWMNESSFQSDQEKTSFEREVRSLTEKLLAAAANTESNTKAENTSLKRELSKSQQQICHLEAQFDELKKNQSEAIKRASDLSREKETLHSHIRNLQEQVSAVEEQLEQKQGQCEMVNSQLEDKEQRLKEALERISTLEELLRSSDERLSALQTQLQQVLSEREAAEHKVNALTGQVDCLQENLSTLGLTMSNAENNFHSALNDYKDKQEKLAKELANYQITESALKNACTDFDSVKEELGSCTNELIKARADSKAIEKEKLELEEHFACLNEKYSICERSLCTAQENISSLELTLSALEAEIQQLKLHLETSSTELSATGEKASKFQEDNEVLRSQLDSLRKNFNDSEENLRLNLTKVQQVLDCEIAAHTETKMSAVKMLSDTKNALEFQVNELQENCVVVERKKELVKQELDSERSAHSETKSDLELCKNQLEEDRNRHLLELSKVQDTVNILKDEKNQLKSEIDEFRGNLVAAFSQNESIKKELDNERTVHNETMSYWKSCKDQLVNDKYQHSVELSKIQNAMKVLSDQNKFLEAQVNELKGNIGEAERQNKSIKQELDCEITAHQEAKSNWKLTQNHLEDDQNEQSVEISKLQSTLQIMNDQKKFLEAQVNDLQCKLVAAGRNHEAIREKHLSFERQLEFSAIEISTLRVEAQEQSNRNNELQAQLDEIRMKSALTEDNLKAALSKSRKELDSQRETYQETVRNLTEARFQLRSSESTCNETLFDRTKLQAEIANLLNEKLKIEEKAQCLERTVRAQEQNIEAVTENNLKLMKDKLEIEETVKRLEKELSFQEQNLAVLTAGNASLKQSLSAYEEYIKITHQKCQLVFTENSGAMNNARNLIDEIKILNEKMEIIRQNAEVVDEDFKDLNFSFEKFIETKNSSFMEIWERLQDKQFCLTSSVEALQRATIEKSSLENEISGLKTEKMEFENKIKTLTENSVTSESTQEKLRNRNAVLENMKSSASQQILDLQKRVHSVEAELALSNEKAQELAKEKSSLENQLGSLRRQLQASQDKSEKTIRMLIADKEELEKSTKTLTETTVKWKSAYEQMRNRNSALNSSVASSSQQISNLQQSVDALETELKSSNEKARDFCVYKTNQESQLGSLRQQLQVCQEKSSRDLEKLRTQMEIERASHEDYKTRLGVTISNPQESKVLTNEIKHGCPKVASKLSKRFVNDNQNSNAQRNEMLSAPSVVTNEEFQRRPLNDCRTQLETGKTSHKNQYINSESPSSELGLANCLEDTVNISSKNKAADKRGSETLATDGENKPVEIVEESPPSVTRKAATRSAAAAAKRPLSVIKIECEYSSNTSSNEQRATEINNEAYAIRGRKKLVPTPSPPYAFPTPSPISVDNKHVQQNPKSPAKVVRARKEEAQVSANDSFSATPFPPAKQTYARKRLSMTARTCKTNSSPVPPSPLSARVAKKPRNK